MKLKSLHLEGYKSIGSAPGSSLEFGDITVLLGANGVGKSNLVSFFEMLNYMMTGGLQNFIAERGYSDTFLHFGSKTTRDIFAKIEFTDNIAVSSYQFRLTHAVGDILIFTEETLSYQSAPQNHPLTLQLQPATRETDLIEYVKKASTSAAHKRTASNILRLLRGCRVFHFHDTSLNAKMRGQGYIEDNRYIRSEGGNLAAFLFRLKEDPDMFPSYAKIVRYIQKVMPQFGDFDLMPSERNKNYITLNWRDKNRPQHLFGPHQISDGSLRFMCLAALLLQPHSLLPSVIILDEPELGLHPAAITYLGGMVKAASKNAQIIIATQSPRLIDEFGLDNIVIVERAQERNSSFFSRKDPNQLIAWLDAYSLSELWEKNVIGGQP